VEGAVKRTTNAGLPSLERKALILESGEVPWDDDHKWPAVLFTRTQEGGKTRDIWGYPFNMLLREGLYFLPFFEIASKMPLLSALTGPDGVDKQITELIERKSQDEKIVCEDFSTFDQSARPPLINTAFDIVESYFQDFDPSIRDTFINIPLYTPDGIWPGPHGVPSGSWWTNLIDSLMHAYAQCLVTKAYDLPHKQLYPWKNQVQGDDGVEVVPKSVKLEDLRDLNSTIGLDFNSDKTYEYDEEVYYLQRYYSSDYVCDGIYRGIYPVYRALCRLMYLERWNNVSTIGGSDYFSIRAISILENCKWHPLHEDLVKWVVSLDKYDLAYTDRGLKEYVNKFQTKTVTTIRNQYSDYVNGIHSFETVKILKRL
jgi:hypothetical protein